MKTLLLTFVLSLFCPCAFPQKITGKWTCEKEVVKTLQMGYDDLYCTYKFKKNGVMIIKIKGQTVFDHDPYNYELLLSDKNSDEIVKHCLRPL